MNHTNFCAISVLSNNIFKQIFVALSNIFQHWSHTAFDKHIFYILIYILSEYFQLKSINDVFFSAFFVSAAKMQNKYLILLNNFIFFWQKKRLVSLFCTYLKKKQTGSNSFDLFLYKWNQLEKVLCLFFLLQSGFAVYFKMRTDIKRKLFVIKKEQLDCFIECNEWSIDFEM